MRSRKKGIPFLIAAIGFLAALILSLFLGAVRLSLPDLFSAIVNGPTGTSGYIFWYARFPRTCACVLAGAALSVSGAILQGVLENKLASPNIIGVNAGAGLGVTICCALGALSGWMISLSAFAGALAAALLIVILARKTGASRTTVILAGVAMNSILTAFRDALTTLSPDAAALSGEFRVGGFSSVVPDRLIPAGILILAALFISFLLVNELDVLSLGSETAQSLGMNVRRMRFLFILLAALLAGSAVSFAGLLGFIGLLVPHFARKIVGTESRFLLPFCALSGAGFVTACDVLTRIIFAPHEFYVGILMAIIGGPLFLLLLIRRKGARNHA